MLSTSSCAFVGECLVRCFHICQQSQPLNVECSTWEHFAMIPRGPLACKKQRKGLDGPTNALLYFHLQEEQHPSSLVPHVPSLWTTILPDCNYCSVWEVKVLYLEILKAKSELEGYIVNYFSKCFSSVVINEKKNKTQPNNNKNPLISGLEEK